MNHRNAPIRCVTTALARAKIAIQSAMSEMMSPGIAEIKVEIRSRVEQPSTESRLEERIGLAESAGRRRQ
jgi:hypothetical protein